MNYKKFLLKAIITLLTFSTVLFPFTNYAEPNPPKDFFMLSIPKSGTHLLTKLLRMLTKRKACTGLEALKNVDDNFLEHKMLEAKNQNLFVYKHMNLLPLFLRFSQRHPEYVKILEIRDLRDTIISLLNHKLNDAWNNAVEREMGYSASFDEKLTFFLDLPRSRLAVFLLQNIVLAKEWQKNPEVIVMRFEDLVGPLGGGTQEAQNNAILTLANHLGIQLSNTELQDITTNLFGGTGTFRKGQIGSWKNHFKPHHIKLFDMKWKLYQNALGYP